MSDQGFDPQQGGYPPQNPGAAAPPPPPPGTFPGQPAAPPPPQQPPAYGQPTYQQPAAPPQQPPAYGQQPAYGGPPQAPPPKKGKGGIIAVVIAIVVLCGLFACGAIAFSLFSGGSDTDSISQAEQHFTAAVSAVESATVSLDELSKGDASSAEIRAVVDSTGNSLRTARDEIASARAIAEAWDDSQGKTDYLAALEAATATLDALEEMVAYVDTANGMLQKATQGGKEAGGGNSDLSAAISAGNKNQYSKMRSKAQSAQAHYVRAALLFRDAHKLDKSAGLDKAAKYCDLRKKQADVVVRMASEGSGHRYSAYNADIKKMNKYGNDAEKVGEPAIVKDPNWAENRLAKMEAAVTEVGTKADTLRAQALTALGYTGN
ncbi:MAG: hypothetical protein HGB10_10145 [Coriobacteriia bacterium]|nr:hypothetical protein [Coriobacteriia bacterium]